MRHLAGSVGLVWLVLNSTAWSAFEQSAQGARSTALGGAPVALQGDAWACVWNPACISAAGDIRVSTAYVPGIFGLTELQEGAFSVQAPVHQASISVSGSFFGFPLYREYHVSCGAGYPLTNRLTIGAEVTGYVLGIRGYGSDFTVGCDLGVLIRITPEVTYGLALRNANRPKIGGRKEPLPQTIASGINIRPIDGSLIDLSIEKDSRFPANVRVGAEYIAGGLVALRLGACPLQNTAAAGIGVRTSWLEFDYAYTFHAQLGETHCVSVSITFVDQ